MDDARLWAAVQLHELEEKLLDMCWDEENLAVVEEHLQRRRG